MKTVLITIAGLIFAFLGLGFFLDEGGTIPEKIERQCKRSYGDRGKQAVLECQLAMSVRYLKDADRNQADSTYSRIR